MMKPQHLQQDAHTNMTDDLEEFHIPVGRTARITDANRRVHTDITSTELDPTTVVLHPGDSLELQ